MKAFFLTCVASILANFFVSAQKITYTKPEKDDMHFIDFAIIGKLNNHYLFYKHTKSSNIISLYNNDLKLLDNVNMDFLPAELLHCDVIAYKDYFNFIYQFQTGSVVSCMAAHINRDGKVIGNPVLMDTTSINFSARKKIFNVLYSESKQKILLLKISNKGDGKYIWGSRLFDGQLNLLDTFLTFIPAQANRDFLSDVKLDNSGAFAFVKVSANEKPGRPQDVSLFIKNPQQKFFNIYSLDIGNNFLNDIRLQADNLNNYFLIAGLFSKQKNGNVNGLYCAAWNKNIQNVTSSKQVIFNDELKYNAKSQGSSSASFNNYFLQDILMRKDGGFMVLAESANELNRGIYYNQGLSQYDFYSVTSTSLALEGTIAKDYFAYNIAVMSFDSAANMEWSAIIPKSQYGNGTPNFIGYGTYLTSNHINFLFNQAAKKSTSIEFIQVNVSGKVSLTPSLRKLDRHYGFMPRFAKQISSTEILIPCEYKNKLCFARIEF
jgi:hypothetical protein